MTSQNHMGRFTLSREQREARRDTKRQRFNRINGYGPAPSPEKARTPLDVWARQVSEGHIVKR